MNKTKSVCLAIVLTFLTMLLTGYSYSVVLNKNNKLADESAIEQTDNLLGSYIKAGYVFRDEQKGKFTPVSVYFGKQEILTISNTANDLNPAKRANLITKNLNGIIKNGTDPKSIMPAYEKGLGVVKANDKVILTVDSNLAEEYKMHPAQLAYVWANRIRDAFGVQKIDSGLGALEATLKENSQNHKITKKHRKLFFKHNEDSGIFQTIGFASWYGGVFHGRKSADGGVYDTNKFTAAHKSLPFGTLVRVTNLRNGKNCIVKITDRGPFVKGRIIDLSRVAATEIGMISTGISKVKIEILGKG